MKKRYFLGCLFVLLVMIVTPVTVLASGNMNIAAICGTDDAKNSALAVSKILAQNKLSLWRVNKCVSYFYDMEKRPTTQNKIDSILDQAFSNSKNGDINYLYVAAHGYQGSNEGDKVLFAKTGLVLDINGAVYKFADLAKKLVNYKGEFVVIVDCCFSQNLYTAGLANYPEHLGRFECLFSANSVSPAYGALGILLARLPGR